LQGKFTQNIFLLLIINFLIKPLYVVIDAEVQNLVGNETYGVYFALFNFCFIFQIILDMGLVTYNSMHLSQNRDRGSGNFADILGTKLILILLFFITITMAGWLLGYPSSYFPTLIGLGIIMVLQSLLVYVRSNFSALGFFRTEVFMSALDKLLMIFIIGYMVYKLQQIDIPFFIAGQLSALSLALVIALIFLSRHMTLGISFSMNRSLALLKKSFPFALVFILMILYTRIDGVMLERILPDEGRSAGVYATGYRLLDAFNMIGYYFSILMVPMLSKQIGDKKDVYPLMKSAIGIMLTIATILTALSWFYAGDIMNLLYDNITVENISVFRILMLGFWFLSISYLFGSLMTAADDLKMLNYIMILAIAVNWGLNLTLIPTHGAYGAAIATAVTQGLVFIGQFTLGITRFNLSFSVSYISKTILFVALSVAVCHILSDMISIPWLLESIIAGLLLVTISFLLGIFRLKWTD